MIRMHRPSRVSLLSASVAVAALLSLGAPALGATGDEKLGAYLAGRIAGTANDLPNAAQYYEQVLAVDPNNPEILAAASMFMLGAGQLDKAVTLSQRLLAADPANATANLLNTVGAAKKADYPGVAAAAQKVPPQGINRLIAPVVEAWALLGQNKPDDALTALNKLAGNNAYDPFLQYHTALLNWQAGRMDKADEAFKKTMSAGTGVRQMQAYGTFLAQAGRSQEAVRALRSYLDVQPDDEAVTALLAAIEGGKKPDPFIPDARAGMAELFYGLATSLTAENAFSPARNYARIAVYLRPELDGAKALLATGMEREELWAQANEVLGTIPATSPFSWDARNRVAVNLGRLNRTDEAVALLTRMADERKDRTDALMNLGDILRGKERFADAAKAYDRAIERMPQLSPDDWVLLYTRGTVLERSGQWERAEKDFVRALELAPDQPYVLNYLGYSWIELGRNVDQATAMIQRAVAQQPTAGFIVDSLGWGQYKLGQYEDAVRNLERAVQLTPGDSTVNDHLGDAYWKVGRQREARFQWQKALDLGPDDKSAPVLRAKLEKGLGG